MTDTTSSSSSSSAGGATDLLALHADPTLLTVVNVWDAISTQVVTDAPGTRALATASHSIAASRGYPDGEVIPVEEMVAEVGRIVAVTTLVDALGPRWLTTIGVPGSLPLARLQELGVARVSYGPHAQNVALTALVELVEGVGARRGLPSSMRELN